jgi:acylphosphatase
MIRQRVIYSGRVQGVGFRATTCDVAEGFEVTGFVRNEHDGTVLLEVQGHPDTAVRPFLEALRLRMGRHISRENARSVTVAEGECGFEIRR